MRAASRSARSAVVARVARVRQLEPHQRRPLVRRRIAQDHLELAVHLRPEAGDDGPDRERVHVDAADDEHVVAPAQDVEAEARSGRRHRAPS